jgi:hypothetical protein
MFLRSVDAAASALATGGGSLSGAESSSAKSFLIFATSRIAAPCSFTWASTFTCQTLPACDAAGVALRRMLRCPVVHGQPQPSAANRPETEGTGDGPPSRAFTTAAGCRARSPRSRCGRCRTASSETAARSAARHRARSPRAHRGRGGWRSLWDKSRAPEFAAALVTLPSGWFPCSGSPPQTRSSGCTQDA